MPESLFNKTAAFQPATLSKICVAVNIDSPKIATSPAMINQRKTTPSVIIN